LDVPIGVAAIGGGGGGFGGAIFVHTGHLDLINSTLHGNSASGGGTAGSAGGGSGFGGGVFNLNGVVTVTESTIAGNTVAAGTGSGNPGSADGGAIYNLAFGNTIQDGTASTATLTLVNSLVASTASHDLVNEANHSREGASNTGNSATVTATAPNIVLSRTDVGANATTNGAGILAGVTAANLNLGPLAGNGA